MAAKKKNKDLCKYLNKSLLIFIPESISVFNNLCIFIAYVREVVKLKFDKDMDQSLTGSLSTKSLPREVNANNQQVMQFANKIWGTQSKDAKNNIFNQIQTIE